MQDIKLRVVRGAAMQVRHLTEGAWDPLVHGRVGIDEEEWSVLRSSRYWSGRERQIAQLGVTRVLEGAIFEAGLPPMALPAEYVAMVIATVVHEVNWMPASHFGAQAYDGTAYIQGAQEEEMMLEAMSPSRLFLLILYCSKVLDGDVPRYRVEEELE